MNDPILAQRLANVIGTTVPTDLVHFIVKEIENAYRAGSTKTRDVVAEHFEGMADKQMTGAMVAQIIREAGKP